MEHAFKGAYCHEASRASVCSPFVYFGDFRPLNDYYDYDDGIAVVCFSMFLFDLAKQKIGTLKEIARACVRAVVAITSLEALC